MLRRLDRRIDHGGSHGLLQEGGLCSVLQCAAVHCSAVQSVEEIR